MHKSSVFLKWYKLFYRHTFEILWRSIQKKMKITIITHSLLLSSHVSENSKRIYQKIAKLTCNHGLIKTDERLFISFILNIEFQRG